MGDYDADRRTLPCRSPHDFITYVIFQAQIGTYITDEKKSGLGEIMPQVVANDCVACGACADVCPQDAITIDDVAVIDAGKCVDCGACVDECPAGAITE